MSGLECVGRCAVSSACAALTAAVATQTVAGETETAIVTDHIHTSFIVMQYPKYSIASTLEAQDKYDLTVADLATLNSVETCGRTSIYARIWSNLLPRSAHSQETRSKMLRLMLTSVQMLGAMCNNQPSRLQCIVGRTIIRPFISLMHVAVAAAQLPQAPAVTRKITTTTIAMNTPSIRAAVAISTSTLTIVGCCESQSVLQRKDHQQLKIARPQRRQQEKRTRSRYRVGVAAKL